MPAVPTVPDFASGLITSSKLNALGFAANFGVRRPAFRLRANTQVITTSGGAGTNVQYLDWDFEDYDNYDAYTSGTTVTLTHTGLWLVCGYASFASNATGWRRLLINHSGSFSFADERGAVNGDHTHVTVAAIISASVGDTVRLGLEQNSGSSLDGGGGTFGGVLLTAS